MVVKVGFVVAMKYASNILRVNFLFGALQITFQLKIWSILSFKCLDGFDFEMFRFVLALKLETSPEKLLLTNF